MDSANPILIALLLAGGVTWMSPAGPHAVEVVRAQGPLGPAPYDDPASLLGAPATRFFDPFGALSGGITNPRVKLVEAAFNVAAETNGLHTPNLILTLDSGSEVILRLDEPATNDPANPYGVDLIVFGNAFYAAAGAANDNANLNTLLLTGGLFSEPLKVSVSPGYTGLPGESVEDPATWPWYRYDTGPYADTAFPTHTFVWDRTTAQWTTNLMDFTKPVNPAFASVISAGGLTAADALEFYAGSGGGTGFDLEPSGFGCVRLVKVQGMDGFNGGEVDAISVVRPRLVGDSLALTPANLSGNTARVSFQWPTAPRTRQVELDFVTLDRSALVSTAPATNAAALPPLPGSPLNGVQVTLLPLLGGSGGVTAQADMTLSVGPGYAGSGSDLLLLRANGSNWTAIPFTFDPAASEILATGVTDFSVFVVTRRAAPDLALYLAEGVVSIGFTPVPGQLHVLERSANGLHWTPLYTFTATTADAVLVPDPNPPGECAFYRLRMEVP